MPFDTPATYTSVEDGAYIAKLIRIEDVEQKADNPYPPGMKWVFSLWYKASREQILHEDGTAYEFYQFSSTKMTPKAKARGWLEVFLGRPIVDGENPADLVTNAVTKFAEVLIGSELKDGKMRTAILKLSPMQKAANGQAPPEPELVAAPAAAPVQQLNDTPGALPWE